MVTLRPLGFILSLGIFDTISSSWKVHGMCDCCFYLWTRFSPLAAPILRH
ncbi:hypothetical protein V6Z12_D01G008500 [Gossypium hirsutum]